MTNSSQQHWRTSLACQTDQRGTVNKISHSNAGPILVPSHPTGWFKAQQQQQSKPEEEAKGDKKKKNKKNSNTEAMQEEKQEDEEEDGSCLSGIDQVMNGQE